MWELRNRSDITFPDIPDESKPKYFQIDGSTKPENVNAIGEVYRKVEEDSGENDVTSTVDAGSPSTNPSAEKSTKTKSEKSKKEFDKEEDSVAAARESRMAAFSRAAEQHGVTITSNLLDSGVAKYATPNEQVESILHVSSITGMPATTQGITVDGTIEVALVRSKTDATNPRLLFSVAQGIAYLDVHENFSFAQRANSRSTNRNSELNDDPTGLCACCCPRVTHKTGSTSKTTKTDTSGDYAFQYSISREITNQFSYLPLAYTLIDAMAYSESRARFDAVATDANKTSVSTSDSSTTKSKDVGEPSSSCFGGIFACLTCSCFKCCDCCKCPQCFDCSCKACCTCSCIKCPKCCNLDCSCKACCTCSCIKCPECCKCCDTCFEYCGCSCISCNAWCETKSAAPRGAGSTTVQVTDITKIVNLADDFKANEIFVVGKEPALDGTSKAEIDEVMWTVSKEATNDVFVVLQYRSVHDNALHTCKMKVQAGPNAFDDARTFVSAVGDHRCPYFAHGAYDVAPVGFFLGDLSTYSGVPTTFTGLSGRKPQSTSPLDGLFGGFGDVTGAGGLLFGSGEDAAATTSGGISSNVGANVSGGNSVAEKLGCVFRLWYMTCFYSSCCCLMPFCGIPQPGNKPEGGMAFKCWYGFCYGMSFCSVCGPCLGVPKPQPFFAMKYGGDSTEEGDTTVRHADLFGVKGGSD